MSLGLFAFLDDIAAIMDDVIVMTKIASKKTAGVLGDDLALNANQLTGVRPSRELPIIWAVTKGSLLNKLILVPLALMLSAINAKLVMWTLMCGGAYLCYEGVEKVIHYILSHSNKQLITTGDDIGCNSSDENSASEKIKIKAAIRTDFILSAEIVVIALNEIMSYKSSFIIQIIALAIIAALLTFFIYGIVAIIVKIDDFGFYCIRKSNNLLQFLGRTLLWLAPNLLRFLAVVGTAAMFIVGGHIWVEGIANFHHFAAHAFTAFGNNFMWLLQTVFDVAIGAAVGLVLYIVVAGIKHFTLEQHEEQ